MYNIFKDARLIQNSDYCRFDSLDGYSTNFTVDGDVDGWDVFITYICMVVGKEY